jgi:hypothetical protein
VALPLAFSLLLCSSDTPVPVSERTSFIRGYDENTPALGGSAANDLPLRRLQVREMESAPGLLLPVGCFQFHGFVSHGVELPGWPSLFVRTGFANPWMRQIDCSISESEAQWSTFAKRT